MPAFHLRSPRGFSLLEVLLASLILAGAVSGLAHLVAYAADQTVASRRQATALVLAQGKLEELRSASGLVVSPFDALDRDYEGYADRPDLFRRRWSITRFDADDPKTLVLRVCLWSLGQPTPETQTARACVAGVRVERP